MYKQVTTRQTIQSQSNKTGKRNQMQMRNQYDACLSLTQAMSSCVGCLPAPDITRTQVPDMVFQMHQCAYKSYGQAASV
ncbi:uncharacterized protein DS421_20g705480 [Arachis hypogaea]|nr:uncharacterized protein DS421_20g705480 [Arachis hypogaea]